MDREKPETVGAGASGVSGETSQALFTSKAYNPYRIEKQGLYGKKINISR